MVSGTRDSSGSQGAANLRVDPEDPTLLGDEGESSPRRPSLREGPGDAGRQLGRYVLLERVGAGGMGIIYAAWDPHLDRKLALKLLSPKRHADPGQSRHAEARMLREAQALAQLDHPNVIAVHDVGLVDEQVFIAMEFVEGETLRAWLERDARPWGAVLEALLQAGEGLAAAHAVGLIHRDFKPDNVMVGHDGRVRVLDFGLARREHAEPLDAAEPLDRPQLAPALGDTGASGAAGSGIGSGSGSGTSPSGSAFQALTRTGAMLGTPAYMSPEQIHLRPLDARSDLFSFCVAAWEALTGRRPFSAVTLGELIAAIDDGALRKPGPASVPPRLLRILERGLAADPDARWPDMPALLAALRAELSRRRARPWKIALGLTLATGVGVGVGALARPQPTPAPAAAPIACALDPQRLVGVWDAPRKRDLAERFASFEGTNPATRATQAERVEGHLDAWIDAWTEQSEAVCVAHHHRHELSAELFDLRMHCLNQRLAEFDGFLGLLEQKTEDPAAIASTLAADPGVLGKLARCEDPEALRAAPRPDDPALAAEYDAVQRELMTAFQNTSLGRAGDAAEGLDAVEARVEALDNPHVDTRYFNVRAISHLLVFANDEALEMASRALARGLRADLAQEATYAALISARATLHLGDFAESRRWIAVAEALAEGQGELFDNRIELLKARAFLERASGQHRAALDTSAVVLEYARELGPESGYLAMELSNYGILATKLSFDDGELARRGLEAQREAVRIESALSAPMSPTLLSIRLNLASAWLRVGDLERAEAELDTIDAMLTEHYGQASGLHNSVDMRRALLAQLRGDCEGASALAERQLDAMLRGRSGSPYNRELTYLSAAGTCGTTPERALEILELGVEDLWSEPPLAWNNTGVRVRLARAMFRADAGLLDEAQDDLTQVTAREGTAEGGELEREFTVAQALVTLRQAEDADERADARATLEGARGRFDPIYAPYFNALIDRALD
ncbi:serine/threonine kinase family protein [Plesiocystis pacifica SIR-1]|uniref:Serine/threonine kinase family protein n=1 Tax=Plesiocystis pacifica SIR-1 TaxID=391625 RepID=A6GGC9_9BACT|nr:serine/threonine kinase family protein [Plesiocystis pacifica SIR-1]